MPKDLLNTEGFNGIVKTKYGHVIFNKNDMYIGKGLQKYGEWSEGEVVLFKQICQPGGVVVEVGANIGVHTVVLAQLVGKSGRVIAFEPQHLVFQTLCGNIAINSLQNVECFNCGVASTAGTLFIPSPAPDQTNNFGGIRMNDQQRGRQVPVVTLDQVFNQPRLNLIKIDVEGMEQDVIKGAAGLINKFKPVLYVENDQKDKSKALIELIQSLGYKLYWHLPFLFNPKNHAQDEENIFDRTISLNMLAVHESSEMAITGFKPVADSDDFPQVSSNP